LYTLAQCLCLQLQARGFFIQALQFIVSLPPGLPSIS
jgi:hypothetical protein